jgi:O-Antigen ligase
MMRLGGVAAFALVAWLAQDSGGYAYLSADRALVAVAVLALVVAIAGGCRPGRGGAVLLGALAGLAAWTAFSYLWSESPPRALDEAQRVALYAVAASVVVFGARWVDLRAITFGVAAAAVVIAAWNLVARVHGVAHPRDTGALATPVGYANALALLCVIGLLTLPLLPRAAWLVAPVLLADLVIQESSGAYAALVFGVLAYAWHRQPRVVTAVAIVLSALSPFALRGHERTQYWHVAVREAEAHPVLGTGAGTFQNWWLRDRTTPISTREAHSLYLQTLAELGPIGLALVLCALAAPLTARNPSVSAVTVAYAVAAGVDFHWSIAGVTLPVVLLGAAALARPGPRLSRTVLVPVAAVTLLAAVLALAGNLQLERARNALAAGDDARAAADARRALRFAPYSAQAWGVIGGATHDAAAYRRALARDSNDWTLWARLSLVERRGRSRLNPLGP